MPFAGRGGLFSPFGTKDFLWYSECRFEKLHKLLQQTLTTPRNYSPSKYVYPKVDVYPDGFIRSVYSGKRFTSLV